MILTSADGIQQARWAKRFIWPTRAPRFTVSHPDGSLIVDALIDGLTHGSYLVSVCGKQRVITREEVIPTVRLFLDVSKRRKQQNTLTIRPMPES
jgi:hypothetical protein